MFEITQYMLKCDLLNIFEISKHIYVMSDTENSTNFNKNKVSYGKKYSRRQSLLRCQKVRYAVRLAGWRVWGSNGGGECAVQQDMLLCLYTIATWTQSIVSRDPWPAACFNTKSMGAEP